MKGRNVLIPSYMKDFKCIGSACEDTCCSGWRVELDKNTYRYYKSCEDEELKSVFDEMVSKNNSKKSDAAYGRIKMLDNGECPFLDADKLCNIQLKLGEEHLSETCALYPRSLNKIDGKYERSATVSCPEVARLALLNPEGIVLEQIKEPYENRIRVNKEFDTKGHMTVAKPQRYFWDIRMFGLSLLQNRDYDLGERLIILGIVYQRIDALRQNLSIGEIPDVLDTVQRLMDSGDFKKEIDTVPVNTQIQMRIAKELADKRVVEGVKSKRYMDCFKETLVGLGFVKGESIEKVLEKYEYNYKEYLTPYLKEKGYIIENYLVNEYFKDLMPFGSYKTMWESYMFLCVLYSMTKLHMIGMAGFNKGISDEQVIKLIQSFSKVVLHNKTYIKSIISLLKDNNYDTLPYMSILVKN